MMVAHRLRTWTPADYVALIATCALTCLRPSLVLGTRLRRRGLPARVCFGVDRRGGALTAHAWVTVGDVPIGDDGSHFHEVSRVRAWSA